MKKSLFTMLALLLASFATQAEMDTMRGDAEFLSSFPHRLTGSKNMEAAREYVIGKLREAGVENVITQEFPVVGWDVTQGGLEASGGRRFPLEPLRPNGLIPPATSAEGIRGVLVDAGDGSAEAFGREDYRGTIVVLRYTSGDGWLRAFRLGARAVIFVPDEGISSGDAKYTIANAALPRFYFSGEPGELPFGEEVTLRAALQMPAATGANVIAFIPGTDPVFALGQPETVVLGARLDSFGEVPTRTPGARTAANAALLLRIAGELAASPPRRNVAIVFFDAEGQAHAGSNAFYRIARPPATGLHETRKKSNSAETSVIHGLLDELGKTNASTPVQSLSTDLRRRLRLAADSRTSDVQDALARARLAQTENAPDKRIQALEEENELWNNFRRALGRGETAVDITGPMEQSRADVLASLNIRAAELAGEARFLESDSALAGLLGRGEIVLHTSLMLGDGVPSWGLMPGGTTSLRSLNDVPGLYSRHLGAFLAAWKQLRQSNPAAASTFVEQTADGSLFPPESFCAAPVLTHSGDSAGIPAVNNLALMTSGETLSREGTPIDTLERMDWDTFLRQADGVSSLLPILLSEADLSLRSTLLNTRHYVAPEFLRSNRTTGVKIVTRSRSSAMADQPVQGVLVGVRDRRFDSLEFTRNKGYGISYERWHVTNANGQFLDGPTVFRPGRLFAVQLDERGMPRLATNLASVMAKGREQVSVQPINTAGIIPVPQLLNRPLRVFNAGNNSPLSAGNSYTESTDGVSSWFSATRVRGWKYFGLWSAVGLNLPASDSLEDNSAVGGGLGFGAGERWEFPNVSLQSAQDLWRLDGQRLSLLRSRGVLNRSVDGWHARSAEIRDAAAGRGAGPGEAWSAAAFMTERNVYREVMRTLGDLVFASLVLLLLALPFSFAMERLLVGASSIYHRIAGFSGFFLLTLAVLYFTHPAFSISQTPLIILLGFAILLLSSLVILIITQKFEAELKKIQGLQSTVHGADVSRLGTVLAAMGMGISTMRRRPLKTLLTAVTVILLTFTIIFFASFSQQMGVTRSSLGPLPGYNGALLHRVNWLALDPGLSELLKSRWDGVGEICERLWISPDVRNPRGLGLSLADGSRPVALRGMLGLPEKELAFRPDLRRLIKPSAAGFDSTVWLTSSLAAQMGVNPGETILVGGRPLTVGPLLDAPAMLLAKDMDGSSILPVDFAALAESPTLQQKESEEVGDVGGSWIPLPPEEVVVVPAVQARAMGAAPHVITIYTRDSGMVPEIAEEMASTLGAPVTATLGDRVYSLTFGTTLRASGFKDLVFPIVLASLVIFGTMLGSVADREKEVYTFSALGLAPVHVGGLFFAEAMIYAIVGGMGGYLLAQVSMPLFGFLSELGWLQVPDINYSSSSAILTILVVMATVLLSAAYPAYRASRSANPGVMRGWKLPAPQGDVLELAFPFTVSSHDMAGVLAFLKEHFDQFSDTSLGKFLATNVGILEKEGRLGIQCRLALAPFDLGVTQDFVLASAPSEIRGIEEVRVMTRRISGQPKDWQRLNKVLFQDLRKQFLIWRSLSGEVMEEYRQRTLGGIESARKEQGEPS